MSLPSCVQKALEELKLARVGEAAAEKVLWDVLPEDIADEIHYNGYRANIPPEYYPVLKALRPER